MFASGSRISRSATLKSAIFERTQVAIFDALENRCRRVAAVTHAQAGAADQVFVAILHHVARQSRPQQENRAARTVARMDARTPDLHEVGPQMRQARQVELLFGVVAADTMR